MWNRSIEHYQASTPKLTFTIKMIVPAYATDFIISFLCKWKRKKGCFCYFYARQKRPYAVRMFKMKLYAVRMGVTLVYRHGYVQNAHAHPRARARSRHQGAHDVVFGVAAAQAVRTLCNK